MAGKILIPLVTAFQSAGLKDASRQLELFGAKIKGVSAISNSLKKNLSFGAIGVGAFAFFKGAMEEAKNYQREMQALTTIFGESAPVMQNFAKNAAKIGLSTSSAAKASTFLGSVLKQSGMPMGDVIKNTKQLVGLASDLATVYGYDVQEALTGMTALFRGEYDPIEKFGVAMKQQEVNSLLAARGQSKLTGQAKAYAQQVARLDLLMQRSADSSGAFAKGQGTLFVEQQNLNVAYKNFQAIIAQAVVPSLAKLMAALSDLVTQNQDSLTNLFVGIGDLVSTLVQTIGDSKADIKMLVDFIVNLVSVAKDGTMFVVKYAKGIAFLGLSIAAVVGGIKLYNVLMPVFVAMTYLSEGATVALSLALGVVVTEMALATAGLSLLLGAMVAFALVGNDATREMDAMKKEAKNLGIVVENGFNRGARRAGDYYDQIQKNIDIIKKMNQVEENRFKLRHQEHLDEMSDLEEKKAAAEELSKKLSDFKTSIAESLKNLLPGAFITREIGAFEKEVIGSIEKINEQIDGAVSDGVLGASSAKALKKYAADEAKVLSEIAARRDKMSKRYNMAKSLMGEIKNTIIGFANLATIANDVAENVSVTTTRMIGRFTESITTSGKQLVSAGSIIDKYRDILNRTKEFATNLMSLDKMNLNDTLYNQILAGGLEGGAAAAAAIAQGGQSAVDELNGLFVDLANQGTTLGESTAQMMYGVGIDMGDGLLAGILAADKKLRDAAKALAIAFSSSFKTAINTGNTNGLKVDKSVMDSINSTSSMTGIGAAGVEGKGRQFVVNVTAGIGTDGAAVGRVIVDAIKKYERTSGQVFATA
jgi:hypothetical protein